MPRILHIQSSPNRGESITRRLSQKFVDTWCQNHGDVEVDLLDLAKDPLPHFGAVLDSVGVAEADWTPEIRAAIDLSDGLIKQLEEAHVIVVGAPMINLTICTQLKSWFDHVMIANRTFKYAAPGISKGLLFGKKVFVIEARGGDYSDIPATAFDFQEPLLRGLFGLMGVWDLSFIRAEGMRQRVDVADDILRHAEEAVERLAA
jgi:FMN-dependent NADH-azoreductase